MVLRIGHRGARGHAPENTLAAIAKGLSFDVDMVEFDVYASKDGVLVVHHDFKVDRTTNGTGYIEEKTIEELRELDAGDGEQVPTLREALDLIDRKAKVYIEIKSEGIESSIVSTIDEYVRVKDWDYDDFVVSSYNHYALVEFKRLMPEVKTGALVYGIHLGLAEFATRAGAYYAIIDIEVMNQKLIDDAHDRGLKVLVCTVNDHDDIARVRAMGVDGIISDFPDRI